MSCLTKPIFVLLLSGLFLQQALSQETANNITDSNVDPIDSTKPSSISKISAFGAALSSIIISELGDKTFFIAAIMAMRYTRLTVFAGAATALIFMTIIATAFGSVFTSLIPPNITKIIVTILFFFFGAKLLYEAYHTNEGEEKKSANPEELEIELETLHAKLLEKSKKGAILNVENQNTNAEDIEAKSQKEKRSLSKGQKQPSIAETVIYWQALTLTFLGEWGDRSQITTIALASQSNAFAVCIGASLGHAMCTGLAVIGGKMLASKISERTMNICGGFLFLAFGLHNVFFG